MAVPEPRNKDLYSLAVLVGQREAGGHWRQAKQDRETGAGDKLPLDGQNVSCAKGP